MHENRCRDGAEPLKKFLADCLHQTSIMNIFLYTNIRKRKSAATVAVVGVLVIIHVGVALIVH